MESASDSKSEEGGSTPPDREFVPLLHGLLPTGMWGLNLSIIVNSNEVGANNLVNLKVKEHEEETLFGLQDH